MGSFGIGITEVLVVLLIALLVFGPGRVPDIARGLGKAVRQFNKYSSGLTSEFREEFEKELAADSDTRGNSAVGSDEAASKCGPAPTDSAETGRQSSDGR